MGHPTDIFVETPTSGICAICHDVLENATSLKECGHSFCNECIKLCLESTPSCPTCRVNVEGESSCIPAFVCRELIDSMKVKCTNGRDTIQTLQAILGSMCSHGSGEESSKKRKRDDASLSDNIEEKVGCDWTGTLKERKQHEEVCEHKVITCSVEGCNHACKRKDMESHLTSGAGIMLHMDLKVKAMKDQMRVETNHMKYVMDCRSWIEAWARQIEDNDGTDTASVNIYQIRSSDNNHITGLLCILPSWRGAVLPMTIRYDSPTSPPTIRFPDGYFHVNVLPSGLVLTEDIGWTAEASLTEVLCNILRLLSYPNVENSRNPKAKDCYVNEGLVRYRILAREKNSSYLSADLMCPGEKADELHIIRKWQIANEMSWSSASRLERICKMAS